MTTTSDFEPITCFICGKDDCSRIATHGQFGLPASVCICKHDGLVYLNPRWTKERYAAFYANEYDTLYRRGALAGKETGCEKYQNISEAWSRIKTCGLPEPSSVLDIGAGMGWHLDFIRKRIGSAVSLAAIEPSTHCAAHILEHLGAEILAEDVDADWHRGRERRFDLAILRHVLEHFLDPVGVLRKVASVLTTDGIAYVAVPNMMAPDIPLTKYFFRAAHTYYFCPETLTHAGMLAGLHPMVSQVDGSEIWIAFSRAPARTGTPFASVYDQQMAVIRKSLRWERLVRPFLFLPRTASRIVPQRLRNALPISLKKRLYGVVSS